MDQPAGSALIFHNINMIPYRPPQIKAKVLKQKKLKPIPSLELMNVLSNLSEEPRNTYDRKNHILTIMDFEGFKSLLEQKYGRSFQSFEKQLKLLGFKVRKYSGDDGMEPDESEIRVYKWRGRKELLIDNELNLIEKHLKERRQEIQKSREQLRLNRKFIDSQIESIILSMMVDPSSEKAKQSLDSAIDQTKKIVNSTELKMRAIVNKFSTTFANQLELYRLLIYKEGAQTKKAAQLTKEEEENARNEGEKYSQSYRDEPSPIPQEINSQKSLVSINVENGNSANNPNNPG